MDDHEQNQAGLELEKFKAVLKAATLESGQFLASVTWLQDGRPQWHNCRVNFPDSQVDFAKSKFLEYLNGSSVAVQSEERQLKQRVVLENHQAVGDVVCCTAVVRELHRQYPGRFEIDVRTPFPALWEHNPHLTSITDDDHQALRIPMNCDEHIYSTVHKSNQHPIHLIEAYCQSVANQLGLPSLRPCELRGDIHISPDERGWMSIPHQLHGVQKYWVISTGGKRETTTKWWIDDYAQQVVDHFRGRIQFVMVGMKNDPNHWQPDLRGVIDLRGQTNLREFVRLVHSACGVLSGITAAMHLAAAVPLPSWQNVARPCVVVAGGREPRTWYGYPTHRILETIGSLPCCAFGGCWHSHVLPFGDGNDSGRRFCERVIEGKPKCMWMVRPESVISEIERILQAQAW